MKLFFYFRGGDKPKVGYIVAKDIEQAKELCPVKGAEIREKVIDCSQAHICELI